MPVSELIRVSDIFLTMAPLPSGLNLSNLSHKAAPKTSALSSKFKKEKTKEETEQENVDKEQLLLSELQKPNFSSDTVLMMVANGAGLEACDEYGRRPLHLVVLKGDLGLLELFIARKVDG